VVNQPARSSYQNVNTLAYGFFLSSPVGPAIDAGAADTGVIADAPELLINLNGQFPGWSQYKRADTGFGLALIFSISGMAKAAVFPVPV